MDEDDKNRRATEPLLEQLCRTGWLSRFVYIDGRGYTLAWSEEGKRIAKRIKEVAAPYMKEEFPRGGSMNIPEGLSENVPWQQTIAIVEEAGEGLNDYERKLLFNLMVVPDPDP